MFKAFVCFGLMFCALSTSSAMRAVASNRSLDEAKAVIQKVECFCRLRSNYSRFIKEPVGETLITCGDKLISSIEECNNINLNNFTSEADRKLVISRAQTLVFGASKALRSRRSDIQRAPDVIEKDKVLKWIDSTM